MHTKFAASLVAPREACVLSLVAEGLSNTAIAQRLYIAEQTVKFHLTSVYRKLGVTNRTEAARMWLADVLA